MLSNLESLRRELNTDDPWRLDTNPYEHERHRHMLRLSLAQGRVTNALEVGCAAGAFTEKLVDHCHRLTVIDVVPQAIARARERLKEPANTTWIVSDVKDFSTHDKFDLIVVAEVLYYLDNLADMQSTIRNLAGMLVPAGQLVFGSSHDDSCRRWGHIAGAETVLAMLREELTEVEHFECKGQSLTEGCSLARFRKFPDESQHTRLPS
ncbi:NodS methyl transferase (plasmid) [Cupriavidus taiwanensis]|uniref:Nodulation protein S n=1 Tax=Cupriavidus taiwanensis TaxID=164546 RepID=A0A375ECN9_9BURK|nr:nodulation methyltransferase NodS [Cupriavidus taiwanensis]SOZ70973.1 NodS methyl transferase [Cupriavidus taiwanensis]SOZ72147.1 NodS methyl transferase [Cupriavidus taiwanensis]SOZ74445.1 NodS methyl transferase [Cupriavidus taiwanensis]SPA03406.1 NodS methyl transferase [Cupriavidus taiwanensis]SPA11366.1 NodS methyl transferase [Cupriavidus taiwanensis]